MPKHFRLEEFNCSYTGKNEMDRLFIIDLDRLRERCGFPFVITSGYRDKMHPRERLKAEPGMHARGIAADIRVRGGWQRGKIVSEAIGLGFKGIGVANDFIHVDYRPGELVMWSYD
jgi:zinc D-Ala-D-Ala carboxypeptidase